MLPIEIKLVPNQVGATVNALTGSSTVAFKLIDSNRLRKGFLIYNDSATANILILFGNGTTSTTNFTVRILPKQAYEAGYPVFQGLVTAIFETAPATGDVIRVTETS